MFDSSGRVSSPIVRFDPVAMQGTTQTGRIYELVGRKGSSLNVEYVWMRWCELYEVTSYTDVTERLLGEVDDDDSTWALVGRYWYVRAVAGAGVRRRNTIGALVQSAATNPPRDYQLDLNPDGAAAAFR
jgi:hypothetical protein